MVGHNTVVIKPSRSDEIVDPDLQLRISDQVRAQFESLTPKRPSKPSRSDPDFSPDPNPLTDATIPELDKFQSLQSQSDQSIFSGSDPVVVDDEYVETGYYKELDSVDKQHHTTGSGFIKVVSETDERDLGVENDNGSGGGGVGDTAELLLVFKSNPATNDWIPCVDSDQVSWVSSKPSRSETC